MNFKLAMIGLAALGSAALMSHSASAMPNGLPQAGHIAGETSDVETVRWVCNSWGRCHWQPNAYRSFGHYGPPRHHGWHHRGHHHPRPHHHGHHHRGHGHHR